MIRQPPAFPYRPQYSIIGRLRLNMSTQAQTTCSGWVRVFPLSASPPDLFQCLSSSSASRAFFLPLRLGFPSAPKQQCSPYFFLRKEVIQPHLPIRLPCYDFTPVTRPAFGGSSPDELVRFWVRSPTSGIPGSHGVTGGVYKTRERIHRGILIRDY